MDDMDEPKHIRFVMLCDIEWSELEVRENLERSIKEALRGERPTQDGYPECDFFIECAVHQWRGEIIVYLFFCDMADRVVRHTVKRRFTNDRPANEIARECIDQLWARFPV